MLIQTIWTAPIYVNIDLNTQKRTLATVVLIVLAYVCYGQLVVCV